MLVLISEIKWEILAQFIRRRSTRPPAPAPTLRRGALAMPPAGAFGRMAANGPSMFTQEAIKAISDWVDHGCPKWKSPSSVEKTCVTQHADLDF